VGLDARTTSSAAGVQSFSFVVAECDCDWQSFYWFPFGVTARCVQRQMAQSAMLLLTDMLVFGAVLCIC